VRVSAFRVSFAYVIFGDLYFPVWYTMPPLQGEEDDCIHDFKEELAKNEGCAACFGWLLAFAWSEPPTAPGPIRCRLGRERSTMCDPLRSLRCAVPQVCTAAHCGLVQGDGASAQHRDAPSHRGAVQCHGTAP
jgi:hypothetical protein